MGVDGRRARTAVTTPPGAGGAADFGAASMRAWVDRAWLLLGEAREQLDALNVFPVPDSDTGTNLLLTLTEGRAALEECAPDAPLGELALALAQGALMGARGNSGIILSQYLRGLGETFAEQVDADGGQWAWALDRAAIAARSAMAEPVEGTALTVVAEAAAAARRAAYLSRGSARTSVADVVRAAAGGARAALRRTPAMLSPLAERGVVDSGGAGFVVVLQALLDVVTGSTEPVPLELTVDGGSPLRPAMLVDDCLDHDLEHYQAGDYEVMYVLSATEDEADALRERLGRIGVSVGVVGGVDQGHARGLWHVHVHTDDPMLAVDAAEGARIRQVCVRHLRGAPVSADTLGLVACTRAPGLIAPLAGSGAVVVHVDPGDPGVRAGIARAVVDSGRRQVAILPCGPRTAEAAEQVARRLAAVPSPVDVRVLGSRGEAAVVAGVAGLAGALTAEDALRCVAEGVERTRTAVVRWPHERGSIALGFAAHAPAPSLPAAGPAGAGTPHVSAAGSPEPAAAVLALGGELADLHAAAVAETRALVRRGDELMTVVAGRGVPRQVLDAVAATAHEVVPGLEVIELDGGQASPALSLGVE